MIPVNEPVIGEQEQKYVSECLKTGWISSAGKFINQFEESWAAYCERRFGVAVSNGTVALQAAVAALELDPDDEVIMPTFTIVSCALAVVYSGGVPVLVDCDPETWCMDVSLVEQKITARTRAIMPVHIYGHPVDMDPLLALAKKHDLVIIEDAAEAHGAEYLSGRDGSEPHWRRAGGFGALSCFSFYANKLITTGEGGMILTDDPELAKKLRSLRNLYFDEDRRFYHKELGFNFRMTNMQAAVGLAQLERIDQIVAKKRWMGEEYTKRLRNIKHLHLPVEKDWVKSVYWMYGLVVSEETGMDAMEFGKRLLALGVQTRPFFLGMHEQPAFREQGLFLNEKYPVAENLAKQGLYLPSGLALTEDQLNTVCSAVEEVLA